MKKVKKITVLALTIILLSLVFMANTCKATAQDVQGKLSVSSVAGKAGEEVTIKIKVTSDILEDNDSLLLEFDKTKLEYKSSTTATIANLMIMGGNRENHPAGPDGFAIAISSTVADEVTIPAGTELATVTFKILEGTTNNQTLRTFTL